MDRHRSDADGHEDVTAHPDQQPGGSGDDAVERGAGAPGEYGYRDPAAYPEEQPGGSGDG
jgi:hypothetical protein